MEQMWGPVEGPGIRQGDLLLECLIPFFQDDFTEETKQVTLNCADLIVISPTCDLVNKKLNFVALLPTHAVEKFEEHNPAARKRGFWTNVIKDRQQGLHLLGSPVNPDDAKSCLVVDFRQLYTLPLPYVETSAARLTQRWRLKSPYLENLSQSFAKCYMRVALPTNSLPDFS